MLTVVLAAGCGAPKHSCPETEYVACGCGCCGGIDPGPAQCLDPAKDDLCELIRQDRAAASNPGCAEAGCSFPVRYAYCAGSQ